MNILSVIYWEGVHDTAAAIVCDGVLIAAAEEERFSRVKHDSRLPLSAVDYCLVEAGISMADVDGIAFPHVPYRTGRGSKIADMDRRTVRTLRAAGQVSRRSVLHHATLTAVRRAGLPLPPPLGMEAGTAGLLDQLRSHYGHLPPVSYFDHHLSHAATSYYTSGLEASAVVTVDGRGDPYSTVTWAANGVSIGRLRSEAWSNSLGFFYRDCTRYLGLGGFGEGKLMGLAAYGDADAYESALDSILSVADRPGSWYTYRAPPSEHSAGFPPFADGKDILELPYPDFAAATQQQLEHALQAIVASARADAGTEALCLGGGVALNCAANGRILAASDSPVWAFAASGDAGLTVGAALLAARRHGELQPTRIDRADWGPGFDDHAIEAALAGETAVRFHRSRDVAAETAELLAAGNVVGWVQGRMEFGPRALGHRSILADPRSVSMRDTVNRLKGREPWRPLAPSILEERVTDYFDLKTDSPFMLFAAQAKERALREIPAVVHVDGSARPQTVNKVRSPALHTLLEAFNRRTGVPCLLNTSFNGPGEPIVCSPTDAVATFLARQLDVLVCGDFIARRR